MSKSKFPLIPREEAKEILYQKIRDLDALHYSYREIKDMLHVSLSTVSSALKKGRVKQVPIKKERKQPHD